MYLTTAADGFNMLNWAQEYGNHRIIHHIERNASDFETIAFASSNGAVAEFEYAESGGRQLFSTTFHCNFVSMNCHL